MFCRTVFMCYVDIHHCAEVSWCESISIFNSNGIVMKTSGFEILPCVVSKYFISQKTQVSFEFAFKTFLRLIFRAYFCFDPNLFLQSDHCCCLSFKAALRRFFLLFSVFIYRLYLHTSYCHSIFPNILCENLYT